MGKLSRKEREKLQRRNMIIDSAEELISELGFENSTMDQIAERAEVGKGTLYLHFKSKSAIYLAICERGSSLLNKQIAAILTQDITGIEMVLDIGKVYLKFVQDNPQYFYAFNYYEGIMADEDKRDGEIAMQCEQNAKDAITYIVRALQIGMQDGSIDDSYNPNQLGVMIWGASRGLINVAFQKNQKQHFKLLDDVDVSLDTLIGGFIQLVGSGISKK